MSQEEKKGTGIAGTMDAGETGVGVWVCFTCNDSHGVLECSYAACIQSIHGLVQFCSEECFEKYKKIYQ
jgi:hypothetical protein